MFDNTKSATCKLRSILSATPCKLLPYAHTRRGIKWSEVHTGSAENLAVWVICRSTWSSATRLAFHNHHGYGVNMLIHVLLTRLRQRGTCQGSWGLCNTLRPTHAHARTHKNKSGLHPPVIVYTHRQGGITLLPDCGQAAVTSFPSVCDMWWIYVIGVWVKERRWQHVDGRIFLRRRPITAFLATRHTYTLPYLGQCTSW